MNASISTVVIVETWVGLDILLYIHVTCNLQIINMSRDLFLFVDEARAILEENTWKFGCQLAVNKQLLTMHCNCECILRTFNWYKSFVWELCCGKNLKTKMWYLWIMCDGQIVYGVL